MNKFQLIIPIILICCVSMVPSFYLFIYHSKLIIQIVNHKKDGWKEQVKILLSANAVTSWPILPLGIIVASCISYLAQ